MSEIKYAHSKNNPLFTCWANMIRRCYNKKSKDYIYYGGKGIRVCKGWEDFNNFVDDMGKSFKKGLTIDRIDNSDNYYKDNCRWASMRQQCNNRSTSHYLTHPKTGERKTITEWAKIFNISRNTITSRIRLGYKNFKILIGKQHCMRNGKLNTTISQKKQGE